MADQLELEGILPSALKFYERLSRVEFREEFGGMFLDLVRMFDVLTN